jgi:hypothetical protein
MYTSTQGSQDFNNHRELKTLIDEGSLRDTSNNPGSLDVSRKVATSQPLITTIPPISVGKILALLA